jgi:hypothetical protein
MLSPASRALSRGIIESRGNHANQYGSSLTRLLIRRRDNIFVNRSAAIF